MKIQKETTKKTKAVAKKKTVSKVRTLSATKKVVKKTKTAAPLKRTSRKSKTIAAPMLSHGRVLTGESVARRKRVVIYRMKRLSYMFLSLTLGILSAGFMVGLLEKIYIENSFKTGVVPDMHPFMGMQLFFLPIFYILIFGAGLILGAWLGFWGWRVVYIEHRHRMFQKK